MNTCPYCDAYVDDGYWCANCAAFDDQARREREHDQRLLDNEERPWEGEIQNER